MLERCSRECGMTGEYEAKQANMDSSFGWNDERKQ